MTTATPTRQSPTSRLAELRARELELFDVIAASQEQVVKAHTRRDELDAALTELNQRAGRGEAVTVKQRDGAKTALEREGDDEVRFQEDRHNDVVATFGPELERVLAEIPIAERDEAVAELERDAATLQPQLQEAVDDFRRHLCGAGESFRRGRELQTQWGGLQRRARSLDVTIGNVGADWELLERAVRPDTVHDAEVVIRASSDSTVELSLNRDHIWAGGDR